MYFKAAGLEWCYSGKRPKQESDSIDRATAAESETARQARGTYELTFKILFIDELGKMRTRRDLIKTQLKNRKLNKKL